MYARFENSSSCSWSECKGWCEICQSHCSVKYRSRSLHQGASWVSVKEKHYARFNSSTNYSWWDRLGWREFCQSHWNIKYRSRSPVQGVCWVRMSRRNTMEGLKVLETKADEIARVDTKFVWVTGAYNIGQGHGVKVRTKWGCRGETLCKVWRSEQL